MLILDELSSTYFYMQSQCFIGYVIIIKYYKLQYNCHPLCIVPYLQDTGEVLLPHATFTNVRHSKPAINYKAHMLSLSMKHQQHTVNGIIAQQKTASGLCKHRRLILIGYVQKWVVLITFSLIKFVVASTLAVWY